MTDVPNGYWINAAGDLVREENVKPADKLEDQLVRELAEKAKTLSLEIAKLKREALENAAEFRALVMEQYDVKKGGKGGNMTLTSYDGKLTLQVAVSQTLAFGPELHAAKALIDNCVERWSEGSNDNIQTLVNHAFQVNKEGRIDTARVLGLRRLEIVDEEWQGAMEAVSDALRITGSTTYLRFYQADQDTGAKTPIPLNIAQL